MAKISRFLSHGLPLYATGRTDKKENTVIYNRKTSHLFPSKNSWDFFQNYHPGTFHVAFNAKFFTLFILALF